MTQKLPIYNENTIHHIHARICSTMCLTCKSGMCRSGFLSASITLFQLSYTNFLISHSKKLVVVFLFPRTPPNLSTIMPLGRNLQVHSYRLHLRVLTDYEVIRQFYSPLSTSVEPSSPHHNYSHAVIHYLI